MQALRLALCLEILVSGVAMVDDDSCDQSLVQNRMQKFHIKEVVKENWKSARISGEGDGEQEILAKLLELKNHHNITDLKNNHSTEDPSPGDMVYIKVAGANLFAHTKWGSGDGRVATLHPCPRSLDHPNCFFKLEAGFDNDLYIKTSDKDLYLHARWGNAAGHKITNHPCPMWAKHSNCRWKFEPSTTRPGFYYIRAWGSNQYMHVNWGAYPGHELTLHPCPKNKDYPNCQWELQAYCMDELKDCPKLAKFGYCKKPGHSDHCRKSCKRCNGGAAGRWLLISDVSDGEAVYKEGTVVTKGNKKTTNVEVGMAVSSTVSAGMEFQVAPGATGSVGGSMTVEASVMVSRSIEDSLSAASSQEITKTCERKAGEHVWVYRWVCTAGDFAVQTNSFRCHYTKGGKQQPPACPNGYCGSDGNCQMAGCVQGWKQ